MTLALLALHLLLVGVLLPRRLVELAAPLLPYLLACAPHP